MRDGAEGGWAVVVVVERLAVDVAQANVLEIVTTESGPDVRKDVVVVHRGRDHEVVDRDVVLGAV